MENTSVTDKILESFRLLGTEAKQPEEFSLRELGNIAKNFDYSMSVLPDFFCQPVIIPKLTEWIVSFGLVKPFKESEERDYDSKDFPFEASNAEECFEYLFCLLKQYENINTSSKRLFLVEVLLLCGTHSAKYLWSSEMAVALSKDFLNNLLEFSKHKTLSDLLCDDTFHPTIFKAILKRMRPALMKDTWMMNPSSCHIFYWLLSHVKHPHLMVYLPDILPPSFMFCSHYLIPQQVLGIKCFDHILDNVPPSIIKADGIEDVLFDGFKAFLYSKEFPIVEVLYPCLLKLPMMNLQKVNQIKWYGFDDVLQQLLTHVDMESDPKLRYLFLSQTYLFVKSSPCFKHLKKSLNVLLKNLVANSIAEEECRIVSLKIIKELIRSCWPRMKHHCFDIMATILKTIYDTNNPIYEVDPNDALLKEVIRLCEECLYLLKNSCPRAYQNLVNEYLQEEYGDVDSLPGLDLLENIA